MCKCGRINCVEPKYDCFCGSNTDCMCAHMDKLPAPSAVTQLSASPEIKDLKNEYDAFRAANPDYYPCIENSLRILSWLATYNGAHTKVDFQLAYNALKPSGKLLTGKKKSILCMNCKQEIEEHKDSAKVTYRKWIHVGAGIACKGTDIYGLRFAEPYLEPVNSISTPIQYLEVYPGSKLPVFGVTPPAPKPLQPGAPKSVFKAVEEPAGRKFRFEE